MLGVCLWHEGIAVVGEVAVGQLREHVAQIGVGFDAVHRAGPGHVGVAGPVPAALVMTCKKIIATVHRRAADGVFDKGGIDIDRPSWNKIMPPRRVSDLLCNCVLVHAS